MGLYLDTKDYSKALQLGEYRTVHTMILFFPGILSTDTTLIGFLLGFLHVYIIHTWTC